MAFPDDVLRIVVKMTDGANDIQNVYHMKLVGENEFSDASILSELQDLLDTAYGHIATSINDGIDAVGFDVYNVTQDSFLGSENFSSFSGGTASGTLMPPQTACIVLFNTETLRSQGRKFLPPMTTVNNLDTDGTVTSALLTKIGLFAAELLLGIDLSNGNGSFGNWNETLERFAYWVLPRIPDFFATQRRRYFGKGS